MARKILMECLVLVVVVSLAFAAVYAAEADSVSTNDSADGQSHLYISGSGDVSHVNGPSDAVNFTAPVYTLPLHI